MKYWNVFLDGYLGYLDWFIGQVTFSSSDGLWGNYFYFLSLISVVFLLLEWSKPWRPDQSKLRKDFWLDIFYMFFNFFIFSIIIYAGFSAVVVDLFNDALSFFGMANLVAIKIGTWPVWLQLFTLFIVKDFVEWWIHRMLHAVPILWEFHKVHHSVKEMGFAAHLRYHWMENVIYKSVEYIPLAMIGFGIEDFFLVHIIAITIGHWNHGNFNINIGPFKYILNNPSMHIWHHAYNLPEDKRTGVNFGISLSIWDYIFRTSYIPKNGRDIDLGFEDDHKFPKTFWGQLIYGLSKRRKE